MQTAQGISTQVAPPTGNTSPRKIMRRSNTAPVKPDLAILNASNKNRVKEITQSIETHIENINKPLMPIRHVPPKRALPPPPPPKNTPATSPVKIPENQETKLTNRSRSKSSELLNAVIEIDQKNNVDEKFDSISKERISYRSYSAQSVVGLADEFTELLDDLKNTNLLPPTESKRDSKRNSKRNSKRISTSIEALSQMEDDSDEDDLRIIPAPVKEKATRIPPPPPRPVGPPRQAAATISTSTARQYNNNLLEDDSPSTSPSKPSVAFAFPSSSNIKISPSPSSSNIKMAPSPSSFNIKTAPTPPQERTSKEEPVKERPSRPARPVKPPKAHSASTASIVATLSKRKLKNLAKAFKSDEDIQPSSYPPSKPPPPIPTFDSSSVLEIKTINANYPQNKLWSSAVNSFHGKDFSTSLSTFQQITKTNSKMSFNLGMCHRHLKQYEEAVTHFSQAIRQDGSMAISYFCRGISYQMWAGQLMEDEPEDAYSPFQYLRKSVLDYTKAFELMQTNSEMHYEPIGLKYTLRRHEVIYNRAVAFFQLALYHRAKDDLVTARNLHADKDWKLNIGELLKEVNTKLQNAPVSLLTLTSRVIPQYSIAPEKVYVQPRTTQQKVQQQHDQVNEPQRSSTYSTISNVNINNNNYEEQENVNKEQPEKSSNYDNNTNNYETNSNVSVENENQPANELDEEVSQFIFKLTHRPTPEELLRRGILQ